MSKEFTADEMQKIREARNEYQRKYYASHKEQIKENKNRHYLRKALNEEQAVTDGEDTK